MEELELSIQHARGVLFFEFLQLHKEQFVFKHPEAERADLLVRVWQSAVVGDLDIELRMQEAAVSGGMILVVGRRTRLRYDLGG